MLRNRLGIGLLAAGLAFAFQALTVRYNYGGDWTGLFCVGDRQAQPPDLQRPYQFHDSWGYDAQAYRLIAHDPLLRRGFDRYVDDVRYRYSRILVPGLAYVLAFGDDRWIDFAYIALVLGFIFLGAFWSSMLADRLGLPQASGLLFLAVPATLVGMDRLTIDVALAAFCVAFAVLRPASAGWFAVLACAALCRETGFLLIAAACLTFLFEKQIRRAMFTSLASVPAIAWLAWITAHTPPSPTVRTGVIPLAGYFTRLVHPLPYTFNPVMAAITTVLDYVALAGVAIALWSLWRRRKCWIAAPELLACAIPVLFVSLPDVWSEVYAFGRTMTPFWLLIAIRGAESRQWLTLAPIALMDVRIVWQLGAEVMGIVKGLVT